MSLPSEFLTKTLYALFPHFTHVTCPAHLFLLDLKNESVIQYDLLCYLILCSFLLISPFSFKFSLLLSSHPLSVYVLFLNILASELSSLCSLHDLTFSCKLYQKMQKRKEDTKTGQYNNRHNWPTRMLCH